MKQESKQDIILRLTEGLNAQQRSVPQLPAQAQARKIKVLGAKTDPKHPFAGYMVGADESAEPGKKNIGPDKNDPYEKGWRAGFRHNESNPYPAGSKQAAQWDRGYAEAEAQPNHYDESLAEVDFNPGRRGFLKKAGAVAATAAMPTGLAGAAAKAVAPAASWASTLSAPLAGLTAVDLDNIINLLMSSKPESMISGKDPYDLDIMKSIAQDAARESWGNPWMEGNAAKAFLDAVDMCEKKGMDGEDIIQDLFIVTKKQYMQELKKLSPEEVAKVKSQSLNPDNKSEPAASPTTGMSGLARAAGAQIGRTATKLGKATATTVLNQPARDMGRIEPTTAPTALPAPTTSTGMQIPKQKARVAAKQDNELGEADEPAMPSRRDFLKASVVAAILSSTPVAKLMSNAPGKMSIVKHRGNLGKYQSSDIDSTGYDIGKKQFYITVDGKPYTVQTGIGAGFMGQDFKNSDFESDPYLQKIAPWLDTKDEYILQIADYDIELYDQNNQKIFPVKDQQQMKEMYSSGLIDAIIGFSDVYQTDAIQQMAKVPNKSNYPVDQGDRSTDSKSASPTTGMSRLARAAGAQIGRTMKNVGKATANTVLNQPAKSAALPAPTTSTGMQIPKQKARVAAKQDNELDEAEFNPGRRGFLKKAGAVAAGAAMPKGLAGAAMKAVAPAPAAATAATSILSKPLIDLQMFDWSDIVDVLKITDSKFLKPGYEPEGLDMVKQIAWEGMFDNPDEGEWFSNMRAPKALLNAIEIGEKNGMSEADIINDLRSVATDLHEKEIERLNAKDLKNNQEVEQSREELKKERLRSTGDSTPAASTPSGMSGLVRAAGAQIGRTMKNVGKATADTILNQPAKSAALPAPSVSPSMQIPKQKARVAAKQDNELDEAGKSLRKNYNPDGKTFKGDKNKMPTYDPDDAMMQGDYDQLDTVSAAVADDEIAKAEHRMDLPHLKQLIKSQLKILDKTEREILNYLYWHDQPLVQIAKTLGMEPILVHRIKNKALKKLLYSPDLYNIAKDRFTYPYARINDMDESLSPFNDDHSELDQFVKEEFNRHPDDINEESGAVVAHGYAYNRQDQRVAWTREFASEAEAKEWARRRNATVLSIVPKDSIEEGWKSKLAGAALAGAAAFGGGGAQAQTTAPTGVNATGNNAAIVQSLVNPVAQQRFAKMHADTTAKLTDPKYTHNPNALAQHQAAPKQQHDEWIQNVRNAAQFENPYQIIRIALNMAGVTPQEVLQNLPQGYKLPTTEPKTAPVRLPGDPGYVREGAGTVGGNNPAAAWPDFGTAKTYESQLAEAKQRLVEAESRYVLYFNGKPASHYATEAEAKRIADSIKAKHPTVKIEIKNEMHEGKPQKRADRYHINKDGKPASLASYADKSSAIKDRDAKYPDAKVHQVGPRGKVKGEFEEGMAEGRGDPEAISKNKLIHLLKIAVANSNDRREYALMTQAKEMFGDNWADDAYEYAALHNQNLNSDTFLDANNEEMQELAGRLGIKHSDYSSTPGVSEGKWNYPPEYTKKANADDEAELGVSLINKDARKAWRKKQKAKAHKELMTGKKKEPGVSEGARVDRMVRHIASSEKATGKSNKDAENIAWATVNKRGYLDNKNKKKHVAEAGTPADIRAKNRAVVKKIQGKEVKEDITQEDIITKLKAKLGDYLSDLGQQIKKDPALQDKLSAETPGDQVGPPVKTLTTDDGHEISIHGNEDDGFRISIKNKQTPSKFDSLDEAVMACEMYRAHRRKQALTADYVEEA